MHELNWVKSGLFSFYKRLAILIFTDFLRDSSKSAVTDEHYFYHLFPPLIVPTSLQLNYNLTIA